MTKNIRVRKTNNQHARQEGFTIIELMIATLVFSVIMLVAAGTVVRFTNNFQKGLTQTATQNAARSTTDTISQRLQFIGDGNGFRELPSPEGSNSKGYCIQGTQFSYILGQQLEDQIPRVLIERSGMDDACGGEAQNILSASTSGKELLGPHMRLAKFDVRNNTNNSLLYNIDITVVYGAPDLLCIKDVHDGSAKDCTSTDVMTDTEVASLDEGTLAKLQCKSQKGSEYCAVSELSTTVQRRL
jgi:prepilin-type N-terminal cleavage/methylation domain-containing protein